MKPIFQWEILKNIAKSQKIPHAVLFYGGDNSQLIFFAKNFAKILNCQNVKNGNPCNECKICKDIEKNQFPDVVFISPQNEKEIKINQIRNLKEFFSFKSQRGFKIAIIERAHLLNKQAQSAFLKLLEEPKGNTIFLLTTEYPYLLLKTILSRVEKIRFPFSFNFPQNSKINELFKKDISFKLNWAKELSQDLMLTEKILKESLIYFRKELFKIVQKKPTPWSFEKLKEIIEFLQKLNFLILNTNINPRLALEILMLKL